MELSWALLFLLFGVVTCHHSFMPQWSTARQRRQAKETQRHVEDLEEEKRKLEFIRDNKTIWDAVNFYLTINQLSKPEQDDLRLALRYLTRG